MKYTPISISPNEAQFLETRKFQVNEIARIFRVPPHMVGDLEKSSFFAFQLRKSEFEVSCKDFFCKKLRFGAFTFSFCLLYFTYN